MKPCGAGGAVIVDIIDRELGHSELVEDALAACGVPIAVARYAVLNFIIIDLGIKQGLDASFEAEFSVVDWLADVRVLQDLCRNAGLACLCREA